MTRYYKPIYIYIGQIPLYVPYFFIHSGSTHARAQIELWKKQKKKKKKSVEENGNKMNARQLAIQRKEESKVESLCYPIKTEIKPSS